MNSNEDVEVSMQSCNQTNTVRVEVVIGVSKINAETHGTMTFFDNTGEYKELQ